MFRNYVFLAREHSKVALVAIPLCICLVSFIIRSWIVVWPCLWKAIRQHVVWWPAHLFQRLPADAADPRGTYLFGNPITIRRSNEWMSKKNNKNTDIRLTISFVGDNDIDNNNIDVTTMAIKNSHGSKFIHGTWPQVLLDLMGSSWCHLRRLMAPYGPSWDHLGLLGAILEPPGAILGRLGASLWPSWSLSLIHISEPTRPY